VFYLTCNPDGGCMWNKTLKLFQNYFDVLFHM